MSITEITYNDCFAEKWVRYLSPIEWRDRVGLVFVHVPVRAVEDAGCLIDPDVVQGWIDVLQAGRPIPPPVASLTERGTYYLHDGNHRFQALRSVVEPHDAIRIAVAVPLEGFHFHRYDGSCFSTYVLRPRTTMRTTMQVMIGGLLVSGTAVALTSLTPGVENSPFFVFMLTSVAVCARWFGWLAAILASLINVLAAAYFMLPPLRSLSVAEPNHAMQLLLTWLAMLLVTALLLPKDSVLRRSRN